MTSTNTNTMNESTLEQATETQVAEVQTAVQTTIRPVSFKEALMALGKVPSKQLFESAYEWGNTQVITGEALHNIWPDHSTADSLVDTYLHNVDMIHYSAVKYFETSNDPTVAEEWHKIGMAAWEAVLKLVGCPYKRTYSDWLYFVSRATTDAKKDKNSVEKIIKNVSPKAFRRRVEILIGLSIKGIAFTTDLVSPEVQRAERKAKKNAGSTKMTEAKIAKETKAQTQETAKPKVSKAKKAKAAAVEQAAETTSDNAMTDDTLPAADDALAQVAV